MSFTTQQYYPKQQQYRQQSRDRLNQQQPNYTRVNIVDNYQIQQQQIPQQIIQNPKNIEQRLQFLESNYNRLYLQQESLLPIINLQEKLPSLINEQITNTINTKQLENENLLKSFAQRINEFENNLKNKEIQLQRNMEGEYNPILLSFNGKIDQLTQCIGDLQSDFIKYQNLNEGKHSQEKQIYQEILEKIEKYKECFNNQMETLKQEQIQNFQKLEQQNSQTNTFQGNIQSDFEEVIDEKIGLAINQVSDSISQQISSQIQESLQQQSSSEWTKKFNQLTNQFEDETNNLYKDVGYIKCEIDQITSTYRKSYIEEKASEFPKSLDKMHLNLKLNNIEEEARISELKQFCEDNTERLSTDCKSIEQKIERIQQLVKNKKALGSEEYCYIKSEIEFLTQKYVELNYQSGGAKKKYAFDMRKIEEKIEQISQIEELRKFKQVGKFSKVNKKRKINIDEEIIFQEMLTQKLINTNIDQITQLLERLEQKLSLCKAQCEKL